MNYWSTAHESFYADTVYIHLQILYGTNVCQGDCGKTLRL